MSKTRIWLVVVTAGAAVWWWRGDGAPADRRPVEGPQAAVLVDGFAAMDGPGGGRRMVAVSPGGQVEREHRLALPTESRVVGTTRGPAAVWRDGREVVVARIDEDGELLAGSRFGKRTQRLCDGVATNDLRWGVGWLESDQTVWMVHGATSPAGRTAEVAVDELAAVAGIAGKTVWCGIESAGEMIALLWRPAEDELRFNFCSRKQCGGLAPAVPRDIARQTLLGVGCLGDGCAFATRDRAGTVRVTFVKERGRTAWSTVLPDIRTGSPVEIVAAGDRQLVVAFATDDAHGATAVALRLDRKGVLTALWRASGADPEVPGLAWSEDRLLVTRSRAGAVATEVVALPR